MRSSSNSCIKKRPTGYSEEFDQKCNGSNSKNILYIVGIGPGSLEHLSKRASEVLKSVDTIIGYSTYVELISPLIKNKSIISTSMTKEIERVNEAIDMARNGKPCAIISSGDPGIYAMAGLVFDICREKNIPIASSCLNKPDKFNNESLSIEVVPGIPALCFGASLLGAPLTHDFATISLSNLLTPWEVIESRLEAAAKADFVIILYNPKSKKRDWQLEKAQKIILKHRDNKTPVGIVTSAMRKEQSVEIITLDNLHIAPVGMQTTVFIGNTSTKSYMNFMVTPRGYLSKYKVSEDKSVAK